MEAAPAVCFQEKLKLRFVSPNEMSHSALLLFAFVVTSFSVVFAQDQLPESKAGSSNKTAGTLSSLQSLSIPALSQSPSKTADFSKPYGYHLQPILVRIHATDDQKLKITAVMESYRGRIDPLRSQYTKLNQLFLQDIVKGQTADQIMSEQSKLGHLYTEITSQYCIMSVEMRKLLSADQIVQYEQYKHEQGWSK